ncbi:right-handed parallel beta-helix repeat-containing protein [Sphingobacterium faecium]|uniref:right-handed parallel beta-helix repeat-containing protein n=1 Tax=Sphingobacterium faecium TaxID=34087 RepID=UPI002468A304|nr:right-handed parallel beta-helix repeat-containing protein [Sphingobacterium faecium]MDH5828684.1 right-handed parallel beta-helix repeat-containing protein [Sphingobacterium faecium]
MNMKIYLLAAILTLGCKYADAQSLETISVLDFGAKPNDNVSDQLAFEKMSAYVNSRGGNVIINIPSGVFLVGRQEKLANSSYYLTGKDVIRLENCENVTIKGSSGTKLLFNVGMRFGSFNPATGKSTNKTFECVAKNNVATERAMLGKVINIRNSRFIKIQNLSLDGNFHANTVNNMNSFPLRGISQNAEFQDDKINIGGGYGDCGIQIEHYGIFLFHSNDVLINNVRSNRFGTDGLMISNVSGSDNNIKVQNSTFDYNSRTGIAIGGGQAITIDRSTISNTGRFLYISTATGIDIEPEADAVVKNKSIKNVLINRCVFSGNSEGAILAKFGGTSSEIQVVNCDITSSRTAVVVGPKSSNFKFSNNKLNGELILNGKNIGKVSSREKRVLNSSN